jgi:hypothetical protein
MEFLSRTQLLVAFGAVALAVIVLDLVRRRRLSEDYALLWLVASVTIAILGFSTPFLRFITRSLGIMFESSTVFAVGIAFVTVTLLYLSVKMSRMSQDHQSLIRELALLRHELERLAARHRGEVA